MACSNSVQKEELAGALRVVIGFSPVIPFIRANRSTPCKMLCAICHHPWGKTGTAGIHLLYTANKNQFFICDGCTKNDSLSGVEVTQFNKK